MKMKTLSLLILLALIATTMASCGKDKENNGNSPNSTQAARDAETFFAEVLAKYDAPPVGHTQTYELSSYEEIKINGEIEYCNYTDSLTEIVEILDQNENLIQLATTTIQTPAVNNLPQCPAHTNDFQATKREKLNLQSTLAEIKDAIKSAFEPNYFCQNYESCSDIKLITVQDVVFKNINAVYVKFEYFSKSSEEVVIRETYTAKEDLALNVFEEKWSYKSDGYVFFHKNHVKFSRPQ